MQGRIGKIQCSKNSGPYFQMGYLDTRKLNSNIQLRERDINKIDSHVQNVINEYATRPWPKRKGEIESFNQLNLFYSH